MNFDEYIKPELLILVPVLYGLGMGLKKSTVPDKWIPLILGCIGIILSGIWVLSGCAMAGWSQWATAMFTAVTQGLLAASASVYTHQLTTQAKKEE